MERARQRGWRMPDVERHVRGLLPALRSLVKASEEMLPAPKDRGVRIERTFQDCAGEAASARPLHEEVRRRLLQVRQRARLPARLLLHSRLRHAGSAAASRVDVGLWTLLPRGTGQNRIHGDGDFDERMAAALDGSRQCAPGRSLCIASHCPAGFRVRQCDDIRRQGWSGAIFALVRS